MAGIIQLIGRMMLALIFILAGFGKIQDPAGTMGYMQSAGLPGILLWPTIALELLGGLALAVGYKTRYVAFALAGFLGQGSVTGNIWDEGGAPLFLMPIISISVITMFWAYVKSKGRSGWWVLTLVTGVIGLVIILLLKNKKCY